MLTWAYCWFMEQAYKHATSNVFKGGDLSFELPLDILFFTIAGDVLIAGFVCYVFLERSKDKRGRIDNDRPQE